MNKCTMIMANTSVLIAFALAGLSTHACAGRSRYLLLDSRIIESTDNAKLTVGTVRKDKNNPLFKEDKPWEKRFDNLYPSVIYDPDDKLYKLWYNPFIKDRAVDTIPREKYATTPYNDGLPREMGMCYAFSKDGIKWVKPELGLIEYDGSKKNNIVFRKVHGAGVTLDLHDPDPSRRYKTLFKQRYISVAFSKDGIHWDPPVRCKEIDPKPADGTHYNVLWVSELGEYVGFIRFRGREGRRTPVEQNGRSRSVRQVGRTTSKDFLNWTPAKLVFEGSDVNLQVYSMPVFRYAGLYLGLPVMYNYTTDRAFTGLAWSPDTINWHFIAEGTPLIANSEKKGDYDWGCAYSSAYPIFLDKEIRLYYGGSNGLHFGWRDGFFCLATLRPDGFAGYEQIAGGSDKTATITTRPVLIVAGSLCLSADVARSGYVKVTLLDKENKKLAQSELIAKTVTDAEVQWKKGFSLEKLKGSEVRFRFELRDAKLYSFSFDANAGKSPECVEQSSNAIFDGKTLDGWHAVPKECASDWTVRDGAIVGHGSTDRLSYLVWKDERLTDFELELQYRLPGKGNTGVEIRSQPDLTGKRPFEGYHADLGHVGIGAHILGAWDFHFASRKEYPCNRGTRLVIDENGKPHSSTIPGALTVADIRQHQWNDVRIVVRGNHFQFFINGKLASEFTDNAKSGQLACGAIALQLHNEEMQVEFKDIRLKSL